MEKRIFIFEKAIIQELTTGGLPKFYPSVLSTLNTVFSSGGKKISIVKNEEPGLGNYIADFLNNEGISDIDIITQEDFSGTEIQKTDVVISNDEMSTNGIQIIIDTALETTEIINESYIQVPSWPDMIPYIITERRIGEVERNTNETQIKVKVDLDGGGKASISTGLGFFDHMLEQIAKHGNIGLEIKVAGDLHVDEHHTIEDTAIALGEALSMAVGSKLGMERYGYALPMDDCAAQVLLDFGGRPWLVWECEFTREKIGDMPTEMFYHFFKSLADASKSNLNIKVEGTNEHHKIEGIFKAYARALKMAVQRNFSQMILPTTKGLL